MTFHFKPAAEDTAPLTVSISIAGGSGTGKTYSALLAARGLADGKPFGFLDTENRRALHYRRDFPEMMHCDFGPEDDKGNMVGFPPERWIEAIDAAEKAGLPVLVIDSFSHAWEGMGGVLELQARELDRLTGGDQSKAERMGMLAWAAVKPRYRRLIDRIIRAKCHIILCIRAKPVMQKFDKHTRTTKNAFATKFRRDDIPWSPASDGDLIFEMTAALLMTPERPGVPIPLKCADQFKHLFQSGEAVSVEMGKAMRAWSAGDGSDNKKLYDEARAIARKGTAVAGEWWRKLDQETRAKLLPIKEEWAAIALKADEALASDDDPFGSHEPEHTLSDEEAERLAAEARAESNRLAETA